MHVLITGGAGFIGSHTCDALLRAGHAVTILDSLEQPVHLKGKPDYLDPRARFILGDVRNRDDLLRALDGVDAVIHLAAYQDYLPDFSKFFHVNSVGTALIYELIVERKLPIKRVVVASSQAVAGEGRYRAADGSIHQPDFRSPLQLERGEWDFRDEHNVPWRWQPTPETDRNPQNQYALSKYSQELMALAFGNRYDIPSVALRYSIVQGPRQSFYNSYSGACRIFSLSYYFGRAPLIYEDGEQVRDFVNIHDVVAANLLVLTDDRAAGQVFNVGGGRAYTVRDFCAIVAREFNREELPPRIPGRYRFGDTRHIFSDISRLTSLGWTPTRSAAESVQEYRQYLEQQSDIDEVLDFAEQHMQSLNVVRAARGAVS
jgi:dTDP-L-rhamnose 4-epimerase